MEFYLWNYLDVIHFISFILYWCFPCACWPTDLSPSLFSVFCSSVFFILFIVMYFLTMYVQDGVWDRHSTDCDSSSSTECLSTEVCTWKRSGSMDSTWITHLQVRSFIQLWLCLHFHTRSRGIDILHAVLWTVYCTSCCHSCPSTSAFILFYLSFHLTLYLLICQLANTLLLHVVCIQYLWIVLLYYSWTCTDSNWQWKTW